MTPTFQDEVQLAGWSETHTGGAKVTFWLQSSEALDVFRTLTARKGNTAGHRFACVLVEIGDDETPVQEPGPPLETSMDAAKPKGGEWAKLAGMWCADEDFYEWIRPVYDKELGGKGTGTGDLKIGVDVKDWKEFCVHAIYVLADIRSRVELDHDPDALARFNEHVRLPFMKHLQARGIVK